VKTARKIRKALSTEAEQAVRDMHDQEQVALDALFREDYSVAATACHRAHQFKLVAAALRDGIAR